MFLKQRHIQNPVEHLPWPIFAKNFEAPLEMFGWAVNMPLMFVDNESSI